MTRPARAVAITIVIGLMLTAVSAWAAYRADEGAEDSLLKTQTDQATAVLSTAVFAFQQPLKTAVQVQTAAGVDADPQVFRRTMKTTVGDNGTYVSASLWQADGGAIRRLAAVGAPPAMNPGGAAVQALLLHALESSEPVAELITVGQSSRIAQALADPATGIIVKVESAIAADRRASVDDDSAFKRLDYAIYLGESELDNLVSTNVDPADLPLGGSTSEATIEFGDTDLTFVTRTEDHLGSTLGRWLPIILLVGGFLITIASALVSRQLVVARIRAENDSGTISGLYERINKLYEEERALFLRLQRALLPHVLPEIPQIEVASKYVAGAEGIEIGGDWYSVIDIGEDHFGFVVGDVSGRGVDAVAEMARARFTLRAYLVDGNTPAQALEKSSAQFDIAVDEHIVTAIVGLGTWRTGEVVVANAGHPLPLLMTTDGSDYVPMPVGPPLGVGASSYESATFTMPPGSTLIAFTDGLVERRAEDIDAGMQRLADAADRFSHESPSDLLTSILAALRDEGAADDIAMLALRRLPPGSEGTRSGTE